MENSLQRQHGVLPAKPDEESMHVRRCLARGANLMHCLTLDTTGATEELRRHDRLLPDESFDSAYTRHEQLGEEGWDHIQPTFSLLRSSLCLGDLFRQLGLPDAFERRTLVEVQSRNWFPDRPPRISASPYDYYAFVCAPLDNVLAVLYAGAEGIPATKAEEVEGEVRTSRLLRHWSDVAFLAWKRECESAGFSVSGLRYIFVSDIGDDQSVAVLPSVYSPEPMARREFVDRLEVDLDSQDGKTLLSAPSAAWVLWMLLRQPEMRGKALKKIAIFGDGPDTDLDYCQPATHLFIELGERFNR